MKRRRTQGFTLIELLLVVVIIGILAAIVVPRLAGKSEEAQIGAAKAQITNLGTALGQYELYAGRYPTTEQGLFALQLKPVSAPEPRDWRGPYLTSKEVPLDPWGNPYLYVCPGVRNATDYDLWSAGPNGQDDSGAGDDIDKP